MIELERLSVAAGAFRLTDISLEVPDGAYAVLMGKTGCGKTTLLEAICGLKRIVSGRIILRGVDVTDFPAGKRGIGFVPQEGTLFGTKTVEDNLAFGLRVHGWAAAAVKERVEELAQALGLEDLLKRKPLRLSGGERQRVALGRALAVRPGVLCLDEPLSALDEETHAEMLKLMKRVVSEQGITALHITHSRSEAERVSDCLFRLEGGRIVVC